MKELIKKIQLVLVLIAMPSIVISQEVASSILNSPTEWRFEKIDFPPEFAPDLAYKGFEELRFAPGMFDPSSSTYFTYAFVVSIDEVSKFQQSDMMGFLYKYYKGLCKSVAEEKELEVDLSKIFATIRMYDTSNKNRQDYKAQVVFLDSFTDGKEVKLNMDLQVFRKKKCNKIYIVALVSPKLFNDAVWSDLYQIRENTVLQDCG